MLIAFHSNDNKIVIPLTALQLLWINLVTDGLPALALGIDPIAQDVMKRSPRNPKEHIITKAMMLNIIVVGILMTIVVLTLFRLNINNVAKAQTMAFTAVVMLEMVRMQMIRSQYKLKLFSNKWLWIAILSSILLQIAVIYVPYMDRVFKTVPLNINDWILILGGCAFMLIVGNIANLFIKKVTKQSN